MNGIGIDYQQTVSIAGLREGIGNSARTRLIGDGQRKMIPHFADVGGRWASEAAMHLDQVTQQQSPLPGPWLDAQETPLFLNSLYRRTFEYLGSMRPIPRNGFRVVFSAPCDTGSAEAAQLRAIVEAAQWEHVELIRPTDALVCRWLAATPDRLPEGPVVSLVVCDTCIVATAYLVQTAEGHRSQVSAQTRMARLDSIGHRHWSDAILADVRQRLPTSPTPSEELSLGDGVLDLTAALGNVGPAESVPWTGPLQDALFSIPSWTRGECEVRVANSANQIRSLLGELANKLPEDSSQLTILLGGAGALWPFVTDAASSVGRAWRSACPEEDIALGAAWWPVYGSHFRATDQHVSASEVLDVADNVAPSDSTTSPAQSEETGRDDDIPPWERS